MEELAWKEVEQLTGLLSVPKGVTGLEVAVRMLPDALTVEAKWSWRARKTDHEMAVHFSRDCLEYARDYGNFWGTICYHSAAEVTIAMEKSLEVRNERTG